MDKKVLVLEGGLNEEHQVSLKTSKEVKKIFIDNNIKFKTIKVNPKNFSKIITKYKDYVCFNALHGPFGEDGQIQKIIKKNKINFTHSGVRSSKICFDKNTAKKIISKNKIFTPKGFIIDIQKLTKIELLKIKKKFNKFIIKPNKSGSSYGIVIIKNNSDLKMFCKRLYIYKKNFSLNDKLLIEEFISGKELTVSTIKLQNKITALAVTQINTKNKFFDYKAKYSKGYARHILPAKIGKKNYNNCLHLATKCHLLLGCNSVARTDFIYNVAKNKIYFLETNTQPGLTPISLLPEQAKYRNLSFLDIILIMLKNLN